MDNVLIAVLCALGGFLGGIVGVGGGILFVPAMTLVLGFSQVEAQSTSLLMIMIVAIVGSLNQHRYGNVRVRDAALLGVLSPLGVLGGVVMANELPERVLELGFAALALLVAAQLLRRALPRQPDHG